MKKIDVKNLKSWEELKKEMLADSGVKRVYDDLAPEYELVSEIIRKRIESKLTQAQLAKKMHTKQSVISRLESGKANPTLSFMRSLASALGSKLEISFK